jgi:hypothetical protein
MKTTGNRGGGKQEEGDKKIYDESHQMLVGISFTAAMVSHVKRTKMRFV